MTQMLYNPYFSPFKVRARIQKMGAYAPMNIFLKQEIDRMQRVISTVRQTLTDLKLAIDGTIIMNETLRDALDCMFDARIPESWKRVCVFIFFTTIIRHKFLSNLHAIFTNYRFFNFSPYSLFTMIHFL